MHVTPAPVIQVPALHSKPAFASSKTRIEVFFTIDSATMSAAEKHKVANLALWFKQHLSDQVELVGYADSGTGTAAINRTFFERRCRHRGIYREIRALHIKYFYKSDTVQPFGGNGKNCVVIGLA